MRRVYSTQKPVPLPNLFCKRPALEIVDFRVLLKLKVLMSNIYFVAGIAHNHEAVAPVLSRKSLIFSFIITASTQCSASNRNRFSANGIKARQNGQVFEIDGF